MSAYNLKYLLEIPFESFDVTFHESILLQGNTEVTSWYKQNTFTLVLPYRPTMNVKQTYYRITIEGNGNIKWLSCRYNKTFILLLMYVRTSVREDRLGQRVMTVLNHESVLSHNNWPAKCEISQEFVNRLDNHLTRCNDEIKMRIKVRMCNRVRSVIIRDVLWITNNNK